MIHPLAEDFSQLKDNEIEERIQSLTKKYFQTSNSSLKQQLAIFADLYKAELQSRRAKMLEQQNQKLDKGIDKLININ
jgi:hypothetical protein